MRSEQGIEDPQIDELMDRRRRSLERKLAQVDKKAQIGSRVAGRLKRSKPLGFPEPCRSAYAHFCKERSGQHRGIAAADIATATTSEGPNAKAKAKGHGSSILQVLRKAWNDLTTEERARYEVKAAEDSERFQAEFEAWRKGQPDEGLGEDVAKTLAGSHTRAIRSGRPRLQRPRVPKASEMHVTPRNPQSMQMGDILRGAAVVGLKEELEEKKKAKEAREAEEAQGGAGSPAGREAAVGTARHHTSDARDQPGGPGACQCRRELLQP